MVALRVGDRIFAPADRNYGRVVKVHSDREHAKIDFVLPKLFGVTRSRAILLQRFSTEDRLLTYQNGAPSAGLFWNHTIFRHVVRSYRYPNRTGFFYFRRTNERRVRNDEDGWIPGASSEELIGVSLSHKLIYRGLDPIFLPEEEALGTEELYQDVCDITEVIPDFYDN